MRKREVGTCNRESNSLEHGLAYIEKNRAVDDVILSGGDPLLLDTESIDRILVPLEITPVEPQNVRKLTPSIFIARWRFFTHHLTRQTGKCLFQRLLY
ncbi:hypothetical protein MTBBW1_1720001 [Desulfamplus magnetovallimortis]|uniref:Radical SAM core domain-containing protein n=1 Tax=Desulfamplus magnetovallimortis TaxID=1246637 RepID=A0A1W1H9Q2_9BACT|nr:hypothetical protein MTBBW1_1720001 [Desulfamplus magnetovallimortis]